MRKVFKDTPLDEITLRRFEKPSEKNVKENVRKFCISIGLLQPGDSRDIISKIMFLLIKKSKKKEFLPIKKIYEKLEEHAGGTPSNIRRHLRRLKELNLVEKTSYGYRIREFLPLNEIFEKVIKKFTISPAMERITEYCEAIDKHEL